MPPFLKQPHKQERETQEPALKVPYDPKTNTPPVQPKRGPVAEARAMQFQVQHREAADCIGSM